MPLFYFSMVVLYPRLSKFSHPDNVFLDMTNTLKSLIPTSTANLCVNQCLSTSNNDFISSTCWSGMIHYLANQHHNLSSIISECGMVMHCYHILSAGSTNILSHKHVPPLFRSNLFKFFQHVLCHSVMTLALLTRWHGIYCLTGMTSIVYIKDIVSKLRNAQMVPLKPFCAFNSSAAKLSTQWTYNGSTSWCCILQKEFRTLYSKDLWVLYQSPR